MKIPAFGLFEGRYFLRVFFRAGKQKIILYQIILICDKIGG